MADARAHTTRSPHSRPRTAPSVLAAHAPWEPSGHSTMLNPLPVAVPSPPDTSASLLGYTSPIRTISPQISKLRPPPREPKTTKASPPRVFNEPRARPKSSSYKSKPFSMPQKVSHELQLNNRKETSSHRLHHQLPELEFVYRERGKKKLKPSPLRAAVVCESDAGSELLLSESTPNAVIAAEEIARQFIDPVWARDTPQAWTLTLSHSSHARDSSGSSTTSMSSDETSSNISNDMLLTSEEHKYARTDSSMTQGFSSSPQESSKILKSFTVKFKPIINDRSRARQT